MTDGEFFTDDDEVEEEGNEEEGEDLEFHFPDINKIIVERNKINHDREERVHDLKNRIGVINLDLFGNPRSEEDDSKLNEYLDELNNPYLDGTTFQKHGREIIKLVKNLQIEYNRLHKFYENFGGEIGALMDNTIKIYKNDITTLNRNIEAYKEKVGEIKKPTNKKESVQEIINNFLRVEGINYLLKFREMVEKNAPEMEKTRIRSNFVQKGKKYLRTLVPDSRAYMNQVWLKCVGNLEEVIERLKQPNKPSEPEAPST